MQHGTSYSSTHSFKTLHFLFESRAYFAVLTLSLFITFYGSKQRATFIYQSQVVGMKSYLLRLMSD